MQCISCGADLPQEEVNQASEYTFSAGGIGVFAYFRANPTASHMVAFNDVKVRTL